MVSSRDRGRGGVGKKGRENIGHFGIDGFFFLEVDATRVFDLKVSGDDDSRSPLVDSDLLPVCLARPRGSGCRLCDGRKMPF